MRYLWRALMPFVLVIDDLNRRGVLQAALRQRKTLAEFKELLDSMSP